MSVNVGEVIKRARVARGLTCASLGLLVNVNASTISRIENGRVAPKDETLNAIAEALGLSAVQLRRDAMRAGLGGGKQESNDAN